MLSRQLFLSSAVAACLTAAPLMSGCQRHDRISYRSGWWAYATTGGQYPKPRLVVSTTWPNGWLFRLGHPDEQLRARFQPVAGDSVMLPHRIHEPNRALWYSRKIQVSEPGVIVVRADDGAQLFLNGRIQPRLRDHYFALLSPGSHELTIRVLNNAMSGGLRYVGFATSADFVRFEEEVARWIRIDDLLWRVSVLRNPTPIMLRSVKQALADSSEASLRSAEKRWGQYPYLYGPWVMRPTTDSLIVKTWIQDGRRVKMKAGFSRNRMNFVMSQRGPQTRFAFRLPGAADTLFYQLTSAKSRTPVYAVPLRADSIFDFHVWADSQSGWGTFATAVKQMSEHQDAFGVAVGDLVENGSSEIEWRNFFRVGGDVMARTPYLFVAGNHDYDGYYDDLQPVWFKELFESQAKQHVWRFANCAFLTLDLNQEFPIHLADTSDQAIWLKRQIETPQWQEADWRFLLVHHPPYSQGWAGYEGEHMLRQLLVSITHNTPIDFVISGHTHDYERLTEIRAGGQTTYLIVGGAGGALEPADSSERPVMDVVIKKHHIGSFRVRGRRIEFAAMGLNGEILDSFSRTK